MQKTLGWEPEAAHFISLTALPYNPNQSGSTVTPNANSITCMHPLWLPPALEGVGKVGQVPVDSRIFRCLILAETGIVNKYKLLPNNLYYF